MPVPIALISDRNRRYSNKEWLVLPNRYQPRDDMELGALEALYKQLVFALKYEGINLLVFSALVRHYSVEQLTALVRFEATGQYSRRIWFLIEWLLGRTLSGMDDLSKKSYVPLVDTDLQFAVAGVKSPRHLVINNLPGTPDFCPLIRKSAKIEARIRANLSGRKEAYLKSVQNDLVQRASAFLLLKDSRASFSIEGESPKSKRAARWGQAIGQAGTNVLSIDELVRLQHLVIENPRFIDMGLRKKGGFVGEHDRSTGEPMPVHVSAKWEDLPRLLQGLLDTNKLLIEDDMDAVLAAAVVAFGFVFMHPFEDGNGRIHRFLVHHVLVKKGFAKQHVVFPVSASILEHIEDYRQVLEAYSKPLLDCIEWRETKDHNIEVLNETRDLYAFFDATAQAELLYDCVLDTVERVIPEEFSYLQKYDTFKSRIEEDFGMPEKLISLLVHFLEQNHGTLSKRAKKKEFAALTSNEAHDIEALYAEVFQSS